MLKKTFIIFILLIIIFCSNSIQVNALETIGEWYSDTNKISSYPNYRMAPIEYTFVAIEDEPTWAIADLYSVASYGFDAWDSIFAIDFQYSNNAPLDTSIKVGVISRETATDLGYSENTLAVTFMPRLTLKTGTYYTDTRKLVTFWNHTNYNDGYINASGATILFIDGGISDNFTIAQWQMIAAHEVGHVIGHWGHSTKGNTQLMYYATSFSVNAPQYYDRMQMAFVYGFEN